MMSTKIKPVNKAQEEAIVLLMEECGEVIQACSKILRHGLGSTHPNSPLGPTNQDYLNKEVGDLMTAIDISIEENVLIDSRICFSRSEKRRSVQQYLRYALKEKK